MDNNLQQAIAFIKSGDKEHGKRLLAEIVKNDPRNLNAWLWLSSCVNNDEQRIYCLHKVLEIDPSHQAALSALSKLQQLEQPSETEILGRSKSHSESANELQTKKKPLATQNIKKKSSFLKNLSTAEKNILRIGLIFIALLVCIVLIKAVSSGSNPRQQPAISQPSIQTSIPRISSSDLSSICLKNGELPMGYVATETINNINETQNDDKYKIGIDGYYSIMWKAPALPLISCQIFLYSSPSVASSNFQDMANQLTKSVFSKQFSLREYGDERIGALNSSIYMYKYRDGRVIVEIDLVSNVVLEYNYIDGIVNIVNTKLTKFDAR